MLCKACNKQYNDGKNTPRILIECGHTQCEECIFKNIANFKVQCAECGKISKARNTIEFPKNLMLLNIVSNDGKVTAKNVMCTTHNKKLEAFCEEENCLICIDCILLSGHKSHEINSIPSSADKEKNRMSECFNKCLSIEFQISQLIDSVNTYKMQLSSQSSSSLNYINSALNKLRNIIDLYESTAKLKISSLLDSEEKKLQLLFDKIQKQKDDIATLKNENQKLLTEDDIFILQSKNKRTILSSIALKEIPSFYGAAEFTEPTKEEIVHTIMKEYAPSISTSSYEGSKITKTPKTDSKAKKQPLASVKPVSPKKSNEMKKHSPSDSTKLLKASPVKGIEAIKRGSPIKAYSKNVSNSNINENIAFTQFSEVVTTFSENNMANSSDPDKEKQRDKDNMSLLRMKREKFKEQKAKDNDMQNLINKQLMISDQLKKTIEADCSPTKLSKSNKKKEQEKKKELPTECVDAVINHSENGNFSSLCASNLNQTDDNDDSSQSDYVFIIGGASNAMDITKCEAFNISKRATHEIEPMSKPRTQFGLCHHQSIIYIFGGKLQDGERTNKFIGYNIEENVWFDSTLLLPREESSFACLEDDNKLYVCGGSDGSVLSSFECFDWDHEKWMTLANMIVPREEHSLVKGIDGCFYCIGGFDGESCVNNCEKFNLFSLHWEKISVLRSPRRSLSCVCCDKGIYAIGGFDGDNHLSSCERYSVKQI